MNAIDYDRAMTTPAGERRRGRSAALVVALGLGLGGCFMVRPIDDMLAPSSGWAKSGVTAEEQERDEQACDSAAVKRHGPGAAARLAYERCMRAKGYELTAK